MLVGGASIFYNEHLSMDEKNGISIVSFQVPGTPGRTLIEKGLTIYRGKPTKVKAEVRRFDFSSHSGKSTLLSDLKGIGGSPKFLTVHGEEESCLALAEELHQGFGAEATAAMPGQEFTV
jgi:putative mRNA 3-end processing factor